MQLCSHGEDESDVESTWYTVRCHQIREVINDRSNSLLFCSEVNNKGVLQHTLIKATGKVVCAVMYVMWCFVWRVSWRYVVFSLFSLLTGQAQQPGQLPSASRWSCRNASGLTSWDAPLMLLCKDPEMSKWGSSWGRHSQDSPLSWPNVVGF